MYEAELMAVATGAAGSLVAAISTYGVEQVRAKVAHFFRRATPAQRSATAQALDDTAARLASPPTDAEDVRATATRMWAELIAGYMAEHGDAVREADALVAVPERGSNVWQQHNTGTGTFIGGDVHGGVVFNNGGTSSDRR